LVTMKTQTDNNIELIEKAQQGDKEALEQLARVAKTRLDAYVGRITLDQELTQDIVQDSLMVMVRKIKTVRESARFWGWLNMVALNHVRAHYQGNWAKRGRPLPEHMEESAEDQHAGTVAKVVRRELEQSIMKAMHQIQPQYRAILSMRCYDQLHYDEISDIMGCSSFAARALFCRAKKAMAKTLAKNGLGKGALVMGLMVFGQLTAPTKAAAAGITLSATVMEAGFLASLVAMARSLLMGLGAVTLAGVGAVSVVNSVTGNATIQFVNGPVAQSARLANSVYCFPGNGQGAVYTYATTSYAKDEHDYVIIQNNHGNYVWQGDTVEKRNAHAWADDLSVLRLPTDSPSLTDFLNEQEGRDSPLNYVIPSKRGISVSVNYDEKVGYEQHRLRDMSEEEFLKYGWPANTVELDQRDEMHERGWTYFEITGTLLDQPVSGQGRIPFVFAKSLEYSAWMKLDLGALGSLLGHGQESCYTSHDRSQRHWFKGNPFFRGLSRPWMGIHSVDSVRRDAAFYGQAFTTQADATNQMVTVSVTTGSKRIDTLIDMHQDLVQEIRFFEGANQVGNFVFNYRQMADENDRSFTPPQRGSRRTTRTREASGLWLFTVLDQEGWK
jgi:RNA polymerase sigma-70 factor, ECF subfamily